MTDIEVLLNNQNTISLVLEADRKEVLSLLLRVSALEQEIREMREMNAKNLRDICNKEKGE